MGDEVASVVSEGLAHAPSLKEIDMCENSLTDRGIDSLLKKMIFQRSSIEAINFANNDIGLHGCALLQNYMSDFKCRLQVLNLSHNNLHDGEVELLGAGIATNNSLRKLDLSYNSFGDRGAQAVAYALECTDGLEEVNLKWNHIKNEGAYWFVTHLSFFPFLLTTALLVFPFPPYFHGLMTFIINYSATISIIDALSDDKPCCIHTLDLSYNSFGSYPHRSDIGRMTVEHMSQVLAYNHTLTYLDLTSNNYGPEDIPFLSSGLLMNKTLLQLSFEQNAGTIDSKGFLHPINVRRDKASRNPLKQKPNWMNDFEAALTKGTLVLLVLCYVSAPFIFHFAFKRTKVANGSMVAGQRNYCA
jgi:hypothetical protein